jgi:hypothetical protein
VVCTRPSPLAAGRLSSGATASPPASAALTRYVGRHTAKQFQKVHNLLYVMYDATLQAHQPRLL